MWVKARKNFLVAAISHQHAPSTWAWISTTRAIGENFYGLAHPSHPLREWLE
jgi:hypothetical protein